MLIQAALLSDLISRERALDALPARRDRLAAERVAERVADKLRRRAGPSPATRLRRLVGRPVAACCVAG